MEISEVRRRFEYLIDTRARFLDAARSVGWAEFERDRQASWQSMLGIYLHMLDVEEAWLQYACRGLSPDDSPSRVAKEFIDFDMLAAASTRVAYATTEFLGSLDSADLARAVSFREGHATTVRRIDRILTHAFVDEVAHVGELVCLFWQLGVHPPYLDWLDYRFEEDPPAATR